MEVQGGRSGVKGLGARGLGFLTVNAAEDGIAEHGTGVSHGQGGRSLRKQNTRGIKEEPKHGQWVSPLE